MSTAFLFTTASSNADTIHVNNTSGEGAGDGSPSNPFQTINRAVVLASPGDTIAVQNSSYPEKLAVRKQLTITAAGGPVVVEGRAFVRLDIGSLEPSGPEIAALRRGIQLMQTRPSTDPTSWRYQANIHGTPASDLPLRQAWETCQHGSFFFLSWHRMYLYYFERILRAASGDPFLALPYWNYSDPNARQLPFPFRQPQDPSNPLFVTQRVSMINAGGSLEGSAVSFSAAFELSNFDSPMGSGNSFGGQRVETPVHNTRPHSVFELTPHDTVHVGVGGWMGSFDFAARDPIFWLHHANINRLWKRWLDQGGGRSNSTDSAWLNTQFEFFDETGQLVTLSGQDIVNTVNDLDYMYDDPPVALTAAQTRVGEVKPKATAAKRTEKAARRLLAASVAPGVRLGSKPVTLSIDLPKEAERAIKAVTESKEGLILLNIEGIEFDEIPGGHYEIYLNLPEGKMPNYKSKYYVGNLAFFGITPRGEKKHEGDEEADAIYNYNTTKIVRELQASGDWIERTLRVTFVRRGIIPPPGIAAEPEPVVPVTIRRVTVTAE